MTGDVIRLPRAAPAPHNAAQYLSIIRLFAGGWFVVRTCPCCNGELVTLRRDSRADADRARRAMLDVSAELGVK